MLETLCDIFKEAYSRNWITARDGNASIRWHDRNHFYITPSGVRKQNLQPEMFKKIGLTETSYAAPPFVIYGHEELPYNVMSESLKPSGELPLHAALQRNIDTEVRVVLHLHPTYTIAAMYNGIDLSDVVNDFPELSRYTTVAQNVDEIPPVSQELADACVKNIGLDKKNGKVKYNIVGLDRHGVVAVDTSPWRAFEHVERLEHICKIILAGK